MGRRSRARVQARAQRAAHEAAAAEQRARLDQVVAAAGAAIAHCVRRRDPLGATTVRLQVARLLQDSGDPARAAAWYRDAIAASAALPIALRRLPGFARARMALADCLKEEGRADEAVQEYLALLQQGGAAGPDLLLFSCRTHLADALLSLARPEEALEALAPATSWARARDPFRHALCLKFESTALMQMERHAEMVPRLREALALLGGGREQAREARVVALSGECRYHLATVLTAVGEADEALGLFDALLAEGDPTGVLAEEGILEAVHVNRGVCLRVLDRDGGRDDPTGDELLRRHEARDGSLSVTQLNRVAITLMNRGRQADAVRVYDAMLGREADPRRRAVIMYHRGVVLDGVAGPDAALACLLEALGGLQGAMASACRRRIERLRGGDSAGAGAGADADADADECQVCMAGAPAPRPAWCHCPCNMVCARCWAVMEASWRRACPFCTAAPPEL